MKEIIYLAGLIDGEGSILLEHNKKGCWRTPAVSISTTTIEMINFIPSLYGGTISRKLPKPNCLPEFSYKVVCDKALKLMGDILPYIKHPTKRQRILYLIDNYKKYTKRNGKYNEKETEKKQEFERIFYSL